MRKRCSFLIGIITVFAVLMVRSGTVSGNAVTYQVSFTGSFCEENLAINYQDDHTYGDRISFDASIATLEDYAFAFWILNGHVRYDLPVDHAFIVNGDMIIEAVFSKHDAYAVVFMDANGRRLDLQYVNHGLDATPPLSLPDKPGYDVDALNPWSASYENITAHTVAILQYVLSSEATFTIGVINGTGGGVYDYNEEVLVVAYELPGDEVFRYWMEDGEIVSYQTHYRFTALRDRNLEAVFGEATTMVPLITLSPDLGIRSNHTSYVGQFSFPETHTLIEYGVLRSNTNDTPVHDSVDATRYRMHKYHGPTREFLASFVTSMTYQRAYLITEDEHGLHYTYSSVVEQSMDEHNDYGEFVASVDFTKAMWVETMWTIDEEDYLAMIMRGYVDIDDGFLSLRHVDDSGQVQDGDPGIIGISNLVFTKSLITVVVKLEVDGVPGSATIRGIAGDESSSYSEVVGPHPLTDAPGIQTLTFVFDNEQGIMTNIWVVVAIPTSTGMTVTITDVSIYQKD